MVRRAVAVAFVMTLGLALSGCGPCGFTFGILEGAQSCRAEPAPGR
jgi:hypothetical protein